MTRNIGKLARPVAASSDTPTVALVMAEKPKVRDDAQRLVHNRIGPNRVMHQKAMRPSRMRNLTERCLLQPWQATIW